MHKTSEGEHLVKKVLGLIGSPRKLGNCEIMVKEISRNITSPHELALLRLNDFKILPCTGCYQCLLKEKSCVLADDFNRVIKIVCDSDALIVAVPTYFLGANACLKRFLDRGLAFYAHLDKLWKKPAVGVGIAGIEGKEGYTLLVINSFLKMLFAENRFNAICYGALPGEVVLNQENNKLARKMATALFGTPIKKKGPACSLCGGDTFRFLGENKVRCMLCSNSGTIEIRSGNPTFNISKGEHELFLSKQEALTHKEWLLRMKDRYLAQKTDLKKICISYSKEGSWIKPSGKS
jgi:multimeric flavodoxin WrbA